MKKVFYLLPLVFTMACSQPDSNTEAQTETQTETIIQEVPMPDSVLRHVVLFGFKETSSPEDVQMIVDAFKALPSKISEIKGFEWGVNSSPEGLNQGLTHAFTLTFHSDADRDAYLPHPAHKEFGQILGPHLDKVTVLDYWTKE
ncbi:stress responsive alpha/beta barrel protein [Algoriphagus boseongensis]|uniref:Stress responsive alpha/beta barrel protein n=1 Tax=Algoriphagus boseongensis TaxID=1442587 RepID=A0A4R6TA56_9BACT|nr:Dabb family protein [Algoriphagus boseongensis]TDQ18475.1 stress responsive alpha/beta barrel protein [Algoriphagus boseongensis]